MRESADAVFGRRNVSMVAEQKVDLEKELSDIRREVIESRNLVIKTDNLLKNLHAEVKLVGKRQEDFQKRQWLSSGVAYALFAALCITGAVMISSAQTSAASNERERLDKSVAELTGKLASQKAEMDANAAAVRSAGDVYRMMTTLQGDERLKGVDALVKLDASRLSVLEKQALNDRAVMLRKEVGTAAFERGKVAFRKNDHQTAVAEVSRFLAMNPEEQDMLDASYYLGMSYHELKKHDQVVPLLQRFVVGDRKSKNRDYAMLVLADSYEATGQFEKAVEVARDALGAYPNSNFVTQLKNRLTSAKKNLSVDGGAVAAVGAPTTPPATVAATARAPTLPAPQPAPAPAAAKPAAANPTPSKPASGPGR